MDKLVQGTAMITGGANGIGAATALKLAQSGISNLILLDIEHQCLENARQEILAKCPNVEILNIVMDVTKETSVETAIETSFREHQRVDILVNAAGIAEEPKPSHELKVDDWKRVIDVNQTGTWMVTRAVAGRMMKQESLGEREGRGAIVNISSIYGSNAFKTGLSLPAYIASKHAILGITKMDARTYAPYGIRINSVSPGYTETRLTRGGIESGAFTGEINLSPLKRLAQLEEVADAIVFLASIRSSYMIGADLVVDGGYSL